MEAEAIADGWRGGRTVTHAAPGDWYARVRAGERKRTSPGDESQARSERRLCPGLHPRAAREVRAGLRLKRGAERELHDRRDDGIGQHRVAASHPDQTRRDVGFHRAHRRGRHRERRVRCGPMKRLDATEHAEAKSSARLIQDQSAQRGAGLGRCRTRFVLPGAGWKRHSPEHGDPNGRVARADGNRSSTLRRAVISLGRRCGETKRAQCTRQREPRDVPPHSCHNSTSRRAMA
jgi:hypothetical protein